MSLRNWAGNLEFRAARIHRPESVEQVQGGVAAADRVRPLGTRHSFNDIADSDADLLSTEHLNQVIEFSGDSVWVEGGIRYGDLAEYLASQARTLANFASLPHISVAGSVATGTHGSGVANPSLSAAVREVQIVKADGSLTKLYRGEDRGFDGAVVALGALGVVTSLRLDVVPMFEVAQTVYEGLPWKSLASEVEALLSGAYSVSLFTFWNSDLIDQVWVKRTSGESRSEYFGAEAAVGPRHPLPNMPWENCTEQMGIYGPAPARLPHFEMEFTPSGGEELQAEYILPREHAFAALMEIDALRDRIAPLLYVSEIRTVAADDLWLSPSFGRDCLCIHFTWKQRQTEVEALLPEIEARLAQFGARPHWGKLFDMKADRIQALYPRFGDFQELVRSYDPAGKFRNEFLESRLFGV